MQKNESRLTIFFEGPFWVGLYERLDGESGRLEACKLTFGAEPKDGEVYAFLLANWGRLRFSPPVEAGRPPKEIANPKRRRRQAERQLRAAGTGTKAQQALKLQQEQGKAARRQRGSQQRRQQQERQFALRQARKKQKHRGH